MSRGATCLVCLAVALSMTLLSSCGDDFSELVIVIESPDLPIPAELPRIDLIVTAPDGATVVDTELDFTLPGAPEAPLTLGLVQDGEAGPIVIEAIGFTSSGGVISRSMSTNFVDGETRRVSLPLQRACIDVVCDPGMTCDAGTCRSENILGDSLPPFP